MLKKEILEKINKDNTLRAKLMLAGNKAEVTIRRYAYSADSELTKPIYTDVICKHLGLKLNEVLEQKTQTA